LLEQQIGERYMTNVKHAVRDYLLLPTEPPGTSSVRIAAAHYGVTEADWIQSRNDIRRQLHQAIGNRIYYQGWPTEAEFPRVTILQIGTDAFGTLTGPISLTKAVLMIEAQSEGAQDDADRIAEMVRQLLRCVTGSIGDNAVEVDHIDLIDDQDDKHQTANEDAVFRDYQDFEVWYHASP